MAGKGRVRTVVADGDTRIIVTSEDIIHKHMIRSAYGRIHNGNELFDNDFFNCCCGDYK